MCKGPELGENLAPLKTIQAKVTDNQVRRERHDAESEVSWTRPWKAS